MSALSFDRNPIARAEFRHQRHVINTSRSGGVWILLAALMLVPSMLYGLVLFGAALLSIDLPTVDPETTFGTIVSILWVFMFVMNIALYGVVILITLGLSARSITREKDGRTWDALVLTNVSARLLVWGKWWASLRALWGDHLMVVLLRFGLLGSIMLGYVGSLPETPLPWGLAYVLPMALLVIAYTAVDAGFTAAMGVCIPLMNLPGSVTGAIAFSVRVFMIVVLAIHAGVIIFAVFWDGMTFLAIGLIGLLIYLALTVGMLRLAEFFAVRGQVSRV